jgi:cell division protease FtsH
VRQSHKTILLWILLILMFVVLWQFFGSTGKTEDKKDFGVLMSELQDPAKREAIQKLTIQPRSSGTTAKYIVEYKNKTKQVVQGEFSGETSKMIRDTGFTSYAVEGKDESTFWQ